MAKIVADCIYVHKSNLKELLSKVKREIEMDILEAKYDADEELFNEKQFNYEVLKYNKKKNQLTFIDSPDWNTSNEPEVGDGWLIDLDTWLWKFIPKRSKNPQIYHSKELFVANNYQGFDIEKAKERTKLWKSLPNLDTHRIGNKDFWKEYLKINGVEE